MTGYLRPLSSYDQPVPKLSYHPPILYDKRYFDSLAGQSLGKRSSFAASSDSYPLPDIFRPYAYNSYWIIAE